MLKTGLANMGLGVLIALIGVVVTSVSYEMANGGGTYVVTYGAIIVGAWRFLLGLFQVLRGAIAGPDAAGPASPSSGSILRDETRSSPGLQASSVEQPSRLQPISGALHIVGWVLVADAAVRLFSIGSLLLHVPAAVFDNVPFLVTAIVLPVLLVAGGLAAGALLLRNASSAIPIGVGFCAAALLFQGYGLWRMLSMIAYRVPWLSWAFTSVHLTIYIVSLIVLARFSATRAVAVPVAGGNAAAPPIRRS